MELKWPAFLVVDDPEIEGWLDGPGEDLMIRIVSGPRDPVEISPAIARTLARELIRLAELAEIDE
jgi:hypothetical protein